MPEHSEWLIPLLIFFARICDVSIGTFRMLMVISGHRFVSAILGFVEVLIWVLAVGGAVGNLDNPIAVLAFAGGYATGTLLGMTLENYFAIGHRMVRVVNPKPELDVSTLIREKGYAATRLEGHGKDGPVEIVFLAIKRRRLPDLLEAVASIAPHAFVSVERTERVAGFAMFVGTKSERSPWGRFGQMRK